MRNRKHLEQEVQKLQVTLNEMQKLQVKLWLLSFKGETATGYRRPAFPYILEKCLWNTYAKVQFWKTHKDLKGCVKYMCNRGRSYVTRSQVSFQCAEPFLVNLMLLINGLFPCFPFTGWWEAVLPLPEAIGWELLLHGLYRLLWKAI